jgi:3-hydroxy acid dehydrogenase/malonic semialdehyde reductase
MKTALVSGATAGIGAATVRALYSDGWRVIATGRRTERLTALAEELDRSALPLTLDMTDAEALAALPESLPEGWREIDLLVNNAGLALGQAPAQEAQLADWEATIAVNVLGTMRLIHAVLPGMVARGQGRIVTVGSVAADYPYPGGNAYAASKGFEHVLMANLKADLIGTGVHSTIISPGLVGDTEFSNVRFKGDAERAAAVYAGLDHLTPDDVAEAIAWVAARPDHVNVNHLELMPTCQAPGPLVFRR